MLPVIIVGFAMITLGVALLCLGEVPLGAGKRIPALRSRLIGLVLISFLPLAFPARQSTNAYFGRDEVEGPAVTWVLCGFCWFVVFAMLFRVLAPKKERRPAKAATTSLITEDNLFGDAEPIKEAAGIELIEEAEPAQKPAPKKRSPAQKPPVKKTPKKPGEENPFDFK